MFGSRSRATHRPDSDYDIVIVLDVVDEPLERRIAVDHERPEVDLFFLRPGSRTGFGRLRRWGDPPPTEREVATNSGIAVTVHERAREFGLAHGLLFDDAVERALSTSVAL
jgi:hypothetical protein